jgi:threonine dehydratase
VIELAEIEAARERIAGSALRTPLVRLHLDDAPRRTEIYLQARDPAADQLVQDPRRDQRDPQGPAAARAGGLVTASAGNMAQGVAWVARDLGLPATIAVPEHAPEAKLAAIERLGGRVLKLPYDDWWQVIVTEPVEGVPGLFVHPVRTRA